MMILMTTTTIMKMTTLTTTTTMMMMMMVMMMMKAKLFSLIDRNKENSTNYFPFASEGTIGTKLLPGITSNESVLWSTGKSIFEGQQR